MNRKRILIAIFVIALLGALPTWVPIPSRSAMQSETEQARGELAQLQAKTAEAQDAVAKSDDVATLGALLSAAVPAGPDLPGVIDQVGQAAVSSNLAWVAGAPQKSAATDGGPVSWTMGVSVIGAPTAIPVFLERLRSISRVVVVDSVGFQTESAGTVTANVTLRFFATGETDVRAATPVSPDASVATTAPADTDANAATSSTTPSTTGEAATAIAPSTEPTTNTNA